MGRSRLIAALGGLALAAFAGLGACREYRARRSSEQSFTEWMSRNCAVGEGRALEDTLRRYGSRLEPRLEQAFLEGPPPDLRAGWLRIEQRERNEIAAAIDAGRTHGLNDEEISRLKTRSRDRLSERALDDRVEEYRSAALAGLAVIGSARAREFLQRVRQEPQHRGYRDAAEQGLKRSNRGKP